MQPNHDKGHPLAIHSKRTRTNPGSMAVETVVIVIFLVAFQSPAKGSEKFKKKGCS